MDLEASHNLESIEQFWAELDDILAAPCSDYESIDNTLRSYLAFVTKYTGFVKSEDDVALCVSKLRESHVFTQQDDYVRRQFIYVLLQEDDAATLYVVAAFLMHDGRAHDATFEMMQQEGIFPRLVELIQEWADGRNATLHRMLLTLMYEMARIQRLAWEDLVSVNDAFILSLFTMIESASNDVADPYHYPLIRVILVLNEQYMVSAALADPQANAALPLTNRVLKTLSTHAGSYKTFGENLILLLNRESETSLQLLILKLLYLVFGTPSTAEYFYTNDLHVLLDVVLRNLLDLPDDSNGNQAAVASPMQALRHTYLRVLFPLLSNSQLRRPDMSYKREHICTVLRILSGRSTDGNSLSHFAPADETTVRLAERCRSVTWLKESNDAQGSSKPPLTNGTTGSVAGGHKEVARRSLGMTVQEGGQSALSVLEVAQHMERPGVLTPSRGLGQNDMS